MKKWFVGFVIIASCIGFTASNIGNTSQVQTVAFSYGGDPMGIMIQTTV